MRVRYGVSDEGCQAMHQNNARPGTLGTERFTPNVSSGTPSPFRAAPYTSLPFKGRDQKVGMGFLGRFTWDALSGTPLAVLLLACTAFGSTAACGEDFPSRPIRIVASGAGGNGDFMARVIAQETTGSLGQPVIVDNRSVVIAIEVVSRAAPDGYTLVVAGSSFMIGHLLTPKPTYDPVRDFSPVTLVTSSPGILVVHPAVAAKTVKELIALARARPGVLNYATGATGGPQHLAGELFKAMAGIDIVRLPYKGGAAALNDLLGGQVRMTFAVAATVAPHLKSSRLRALAVTSAEPTAIAPGLPTIAASGLPGYEAVQLLGLFVPARTPAKIVDRLNREIVRAVIRPEVKQKFLDSGVEVIGSTPERLAAAVQSEIARMEKVIKQAGIRGD